MRLISCLVLSFVAVLVSPAPARSQQSDGDEDVATLVSRLSLDRFKETLKGLTAFGDRRQGTERNRNAIEWIEARLKAVGCT